MVSFGSELIEAGLVESPWDEAECGVGSCLISFLLC